MEKYKHVIKSQIWVTQKFKLCIYKPVPIFRDITFITARNATARSAENCFLLTEDRAKKSLCLPIQ